MCDLARGRFAAAVEWNALAVPAAALVALMSVEAIVRIAGALGQERSGAAGEASSPARTAAPYERRRTNG